MSIGIVYIFPAIYLYILHIAGNRQTWYNNSIMEEVSKFPAPPAERRKIMPVPKANQRAVNKYKKNNYDRIEITVPKGRREIFQAHAATQNESTNAFIGRAIQEAIERDTGATEAGDIHLPPNTIKAAQEAAKAAGEAVPVFIARAVETQAKRDKTSLAMGINPATGG